MDVLTLVEARGREIAAAFTQRGLGAQQVAQLLQGQPLSYAGEDRALTTYSWRPIPEGGGRAWAVVDVAGRRVARLDAPAAPGEAWTFRLG